MDLQEIKLRGLAWTGSSCLEDRDECEHGRELTVSNKRLEIL